MNTKVWAHRGASAYAPENTLEAFELAAQMHADGVELDIQLTRDGEVVVTHDEEIKRVTGQPGYVKDYTLAELKQMQFNRTHPEFDNARIPTLEEIGAPEGLAKLSDARHGLLLLCGRTGSGKSTTLAALLLAMARRRHLHSISLEDPVEFLYHEDGSIFHQRELGRDFTAFDAAVRSALREDPDVLLISELRDCETIRAALAAAEAGTLVLSTIHARTAAEAPQRLADFFPAEEQGSVRAAFAASLTAIASERLVRVPHGRRAVYELLLRTPAICHMIRTADNVAAKWNLTREELDEFSAWSQTKCAEAREAGKFKDEIVPVEVKQKKQTIVFDTDEGPRGRQTAADIAKLKPINADGVTTAGNASGINDGAAALVVMSEKKAKELGVKPMAVWVAGALGGVDPAIMGVGPVVATKRVLAKTGLTIDDFDLYEANEAFAAQSVAVGKELKFDMDKLNVNGGAIAIGHPVGASGARILTTLLYEMQKRNSKRGLATLCIGGGMGCATVVERYE